MALDKGRMVVSYGAIPKDISIGILILSESRKNNWLLHTCGTKINLYSLVYHIQPKVQKERLRASIHRDGNFPKNIIGALTQVEDLIECWARVCRFTSWGFADLRPTCLPIYVRPNSSALILFSDKTEVFRKNCRAYLIYIILSYCYSTELVTRTHLHCVFPQYLLQSIDSPSIHPL